MTLRIVDSVELITGSEIPPRLEIVVSLERPDGIPEEFGVCFGIVNDRKAPANVRDFELIISRNKTDKVHYVFRTVRGNDAMSNFLMGLAGHLNELASDIKTKKPGKQK